MRLEATTAGGDNDDQEEEECDEEFEYCQSKCESTQADEALLRDGAATTAHMRDNSPDGCTRSEADSSSEDSDESESSQSGSSHSALSVHSSSSDGSSDSDSAQSNTTEDTILYLFAGSDMTAKESLLKILQIYVKERWTKNSLDSICKLISKMLPRPNEFPTSSKDALSKLEALTSTCSECEYIYCDECLQLVEMESDSCHHSAGHSKFYSFPVDEQIKHMFEERGLGKVIDSYREHPSRKFGHICDIADGTEYKKVKAHLLNPYDLVLLWNTDGVALSSSSKVKLWPVLCTIAEVPPRLRSSFIVVAGVWVSNEDPDMNVYLKPFVNSLENLWETGFSWIHPVSKEAVISKIVAPVFCADAPAKAQVLNHKNHNSRYGCLACEQKTKKIELPNQDNDVTPEGRRKPRLRRFLFQEDEAPARSGERMNLLGKLAELRGKPRKGVIGNSVISDIPHSDRAFCICAEYMHLILLGAVKYLVLKIFDETGPWYLGDKVEEINEFIENIKVPDFITRLPRKIKDLKYWKASELRAFLLYYSVPIFKDLFPDKYFQHWILLVGAVYILLKDEISEDDLNSAEIMIRSFVRDIGPLYGDNCYVYNMHNLLHLCTFVRRWGPLWATSAFIFESFNGFLAANVHGTKNLGKELINNIKIAQSVAILDNVVNAPPPDGHHCFRSRQQVNELLGRPLQKETLSDDEVLAIDSSRHLGCYLMYARAKVSSVIYTSEMYDAHKRRANSFVQFKCDGSERLEYGQIVLFIKAENASVYCLVKVFKILQIELVHHVMTRYILRHLLPVEESGRLIILPVNCLLTKVLKMGMYLGTRPNPYEVNL